MIGRREFLRSTGRATLGAAAIAALPSWAAHARLDTATGARFGVAWPSVQPTGRGALSADALDTCSRLVDRLLEQGAMPVATLSRGELPQALVDAGGWTERATAARFADYAGLVADVLGDRVRHWVLQEEPSRFLRAANPEFARYLRSTHVANLAVGHGYRAIRAATTGFDAAPARIGTILRHDLLEPASRGAEDAAAAERCRRFEIDWFLWPALRGAYPAALLEQPPFHLLGVRDADVEIARVPLKFVGLIAGKRCVVSRDGGAGLCYARRETDRAPSDGEMLDIVSQVTRRCGIMAFATGPL